MLGVFRPRVPQRQISEWGHPIDPKEVPPNLLPVPPPSSCFSEREENWAWLLALVKLCSGEASMNKQWQTAHWGSLHQGTLAILPTGHRIKSPWFVQGDFSKWYTTGPGLWAPSWKTENPSQSLWKACLLMPLISTHGNATWMHCPTFLLKTSETTFPIFFYFAKLGKSL